MIKFLVMDVDGTLTDGKIYIGKDGEIFKVFDVKDGCGIKDLLPALNITPVIITARMSDALKCRCKELDVVELHQGVRNKKTVLEDLLDRYSKLLNESLSLENCAYIGDDILDLQCMEVIKENGGVVGCPNDAVESVKNISDFISSKNGGNGAVREFIEWIGKGV